MKAITPNCCSIPEVELAPANIGFMGDDMGMELEYKGVANVRGDRLSFFHRLRHTGFHGGNTIEFQELLGFPFTQ